MDLLTLSFVILFVIIILGSTLLLVFRRRRRRLSPSQKQRIQVAWARIRALGDTPQAVLEADKLLDYTLRLKGKTGPLGNKLQQSDSLFSDPQQVWHAHKLRNRLAHELDFHPSQKQIQTAIRAFERALRDLRILT